MEFYWWLHLGKTATCSGWILLTYCWTLSTATSSLSVSALVVVLLCLQDFLVYTRWTCEGSDKTRELAGDAESVGDRQTNHPRVGSAHVVLDNLRKGSGQEYSTITKLVGKRRSPTAITATPATTPQPKSWRRNSSHWLAACNKKDCDPYESFMYKEHGKSKVPGNIH